MKISKCNECSKEYTKRNMTKFCSPQCYWKNMNGKKHDYGWKVSLALKGRVKTKEHLEKIAKALRVRKDKKCVICTKVFYPQSSFQKCCSHECGAVSRTRKKEMKCKGCEKLLYVLPHRKFCSSECFSSHSSKAREGKNNPNYKSGLYLDRRRGKKGRQEGKHLQACVKYRKAFLKKSEYLYCEQCGVNENGTPQFQVHHIYSASKMPRHENLHNFKNLIMVCLSCHHKFHAGKTYQIEFEKLEKERGLKELFK